MIYNTFQKTREQKDFIIITTYIYIYNLQTKNTYVGSTSNEYNF